LLHYFFGFYSNATKEVFPLFLPHE
jgi:hypothetical protein